LSKSKDKQNNIARTILNVQDRLNPLHVHCRLVEKGFGKSWSLSISKWYQVLIYSWLVWISIVGVKICTLWDAHELSGWSSERSEIKQIIALLVTSAFALMGTVASAVYILFKWIP
jgi:hypothetical protein